MSSLLLLVIVAIVVVGFPILLVTIIMSSRSRNGGAARQTISRPPMPEPSREERQAILQRLADGDLDQDQAENELGQLGSPVPTEMPPPPPTRSGGKGCLIALMVALALIPLLLGTLIWLHFASFRDMQHEERQRAVEALRQQARIVHDLSKPNELAPVTTVVESAKTVQTNTITEQGKETETQP